MKYYELNGLACEDEDASFVMFRLKKE